MKKNNRNHSLIVLYDEQNRIFFQNRKSISKIWEEYWFFGWWVEAWETFEDTLIREVKEELNIQLDPSKIHKACEFTKTITWLWESKTVIFTSPFEKKYLVTLKIQEWDGGEWLSLDEIKQKKIFPHDYLIISMLEDYFHNLNL